MFISRFLFLFLYTLTPSTPGLSRLSRCASPGCRNQSDNASLMRYQAGAVRAGAIGALDKHDNKESRQVRLRWMACRIDDDRIDRQCRVASERDQHVPYIVRGQILYIGHVDNRSVHRWVIEGCIRGRKVGNG